MIIKVMRNADDWTMLDGIDQIQVNRINSKKESEEKGCLDSRTYHVVASVFDENKPVDTYTQIVFQDRLGDWCSVAFNTEAFICSNDGKTVERIYG